MWSVVNTLRVVSFFMISCNLAPGSTCSCTADEVLLACASDTKNPVNSLLL